MINKILKSFLAFLLLTTIFSCTTKKTEKNRNIITVTGTGISSAKTDQVSLDFIITTSDRICTEANLKSEENTANFTEAVKACGIDINDIKIKENLITQEQNRFTVSKKINVIIRNLYNVSKVIDEAIGIGKANSLEKYELILSDEETVKKESELNAVKNAYENASVIATASGCKLGKVLAIQNINGFEPAYFEKTEKTNNDYTVKTVVNITYEITE